MPIYPIHHEYVGPNDYIGGTHNKHHRLYGKYITFSTQPGRTNMSGEERAEGWLGTTNDWCETALGEYPDGGAALDAVRANIGEDFELSEDADDEGEDAYYECDGTGGGELVTVPRWYIRPVGIDSMWEASDWLQDCRSLVEDRLRAAGIGAVKIELANEAATEGIELLGLRQHLEWVSEGMAEDDEEEE